MEENLLSQLTNLRKLFAEAAPTDSKIVSDYGWTIVKVLLQHASDIDSHTVRQLLADCIKLPIERPSKLHSALLSAAVNAAELYNEFHFIPFLQLWDLSNLRKEDLERKDNPKEPSHPFPSLVDRTVRRYALSRAMRPEEELTEDQLACLRPHYAALRFMPLQPMLVTRIKEATSKEGRKFIFVTLTSPQGLEVETTIHQLQPNPLRPVPEGKRHFPNIGQLYDCILRSKNADNVLYGESADLKQTKALSSTTLYKAYLSQSVPKDYFPLEVGYIEHIDREHGHMHIYDRYSRHFVAHVLRFSKEREGQFVNFLPVIPTNSKFKTAVITGYSPMPEPAPDGLVRPIRITCINPQKGYAVWRLLDESCPIQERLSTYQQAHAENPSAYTEGYLPLDMLGRSEEFTPDKIPTYYNRSYVAIIFLHRGKDNIKRPRVARLIMP